MMIKVWSERIEWKKDGSNPKVIPIRVAACKNSPICDMTPNVATPVATAAARWCRCGSGEWAMCNRSQSRFSDELLSFAETPRRPCSPTRVVVTEIFIGHQVVAGS